MKLTIKILLVLIFFTAFNQSSFKEDQKKYPRVKKAYADKETIVLDLLSKHSINIKSLQIYIRAFKEEEKIELWAKNKSDITFKLIKEYNICQTSGSLGPKRKQGDLQIPEGFYHINRFNPYSNFYLSLGINYPNKSDKILGVKGRLGGDIFIHGSCVTIGCLPITDDKIKELYLFCVEAKNSGQSKIPVTIFPTHLTENNFDNLIVDYRSDPDNTELWEDLKQAYTMFNNTRQLPNITFLENGRHKVSNAN